MSLQEYSMAQLFTPLTLRDVVLRNRIAVSPMCQYSSVDGFAGDWHLVNLGSRAVGGAGLVMTEATAVSPEGRISPFDLGIWSDDHVPMLKRIATFIREQNATPGIQLAHAGRKASTLPPWKGMGLIPIDKGGWKTVAPSPIPFSPQYDTPIELTTDAIKKVITDFTAATRRALDAGFQVAEIHGAHGYLLNEFLSPLANKRIDSYGGSFHNRIRILLEVVRGVRTVWPKRLPLFVRLSCVDWVEDGWSLDDSVALARELRDGGVDLIDCSSGGMVPDAKIPAAPGYQVPFAERIRKEAQIATGAVGIIIAPDQAEAIIADGKADIVLMAREMLRDPYFPLRAASTLNEDVPWPVQYERAKRKKP
jgi:2,4-dienoyl-CoA reductase-like NADH-dependent reductase (Old Yellow Enzyme family)